MRKLARKIFIISAFAFLIMLAAFFIVSIFHAYKFTHPKRDAGFKPKSMELGFKDTMIATFTGVSPERKVVRYYPSDYRLAYENASFMSRDGLTLKGWFIKAKNPKGTIILLHGWDSSKDGLLNYSNFLNRNGYNTFLFDFRGFGESDGDYTSLGYYERYDVLGAVDYLNTREDIDKNRIGVLAFSMGGAAWVMAAKDENEFKAIILDSVYTTIHQNAARRFKVVYGFPKFPFATSLTFFGGLINGFNGFDLAPVKYIGKINTPILFIQGSNDNQVFIEDAQKLYQKANEPKSLWIVGGAKHTNSYDINNIEYEKKVIGFFDLHLE